MTKDSLRKQYLPIKELLLHRPRINSMLNKGLNYSLITVIAGHGYDKTQTVAHFALNVDARLVWVRLNPLCNSPSIFWATLIQALEYELPNLADTLKTRDFPSSLSDLDTFLNLLGSDAAGGKKILWVLDDYNNIDNTQVRAFINLIVDTSAENICFVLISSTKSDHNVSGMKHGCSLMAITAEDLRYTSDEIEELFSLHGMALTHADVKRITDETEGWPLGLNILATQNTERPLSEKTFLPLSSELFEYEYFINYPPHVQRLLIKLSLLSSFSIPMIRKIGVDGDIESTIQMLSTHMFINYDYVTQYMEMSKVYQSFLAHRQHILSEEDKTRLYQIAGEVFFADGRYFEAAECYEQCRDYKRLFDVAYSRPVGRMPHSSAKYWLDCLDHMPREIVHQTPMIDYYRALLYLNNVQVAKATRIMKELKARLEKDEKNEANLMLLGEVHCVLGDISLMKGTEDFLHHFKRAFELIPNGSIVRKRELRYVCNSYTFFLPNNKPGAYERILELIFEAAPYMDTVSNGSGYGFEQLFATEASLARYDLDNAILFAYQAIFKAEEQEQYDIICNAHFLLARIFAIQGDFQQAKEHILAVHDIVKAHNLTDLHELRDYIMGSAYIALADFDNVASWIVQYDSRSDGYTTIDVGRNKLICIAYLIAKMEYHSAIAALNLLDSLFQKKHLWRLRLRANIMKAECYLHLGDEENAAKFFWAAYTMTYDNGIITPFVEFGNSMRALCNLASRSEYDFDAKWLENISQKAMQYSKRIAAMTVAYNKEHHRTGYSEKLLTTRETEVLNCLAQGFTREEIADSLSISINGVKKHITGIYNKLGAVNRADAIHIAITMRYLS